MKKINRFAAMAASWIRATKQANLIGCSNAFWFSDL